MRSRIRAAASGWRRDLGYALRNLRKAPTFAVLAGLSLAVGIGLNTTLFSVIKSVLLDPLPFPNAERLVAVHENVPKYQVLSQPMSPIEFSMIQKVARSYAALGAYECITGEWSSGSPAEMLNGAKLTASMFDVLGVQPVVGRTFREDEDYEGSSVVMISYGLWARRFGRDPGVIGRTVNLDRKALTVIGVTPKSFVFPLRGPADNSQPADYYVPMGFTVLERQGRGPILNKSVIGRLREGVTVQTAAAEAGTLMPVLEQQFPARYLQGARDGLSVTLVPLQEEVVGHVRLVLWLLMGAVAILLLIACANVANLMLARAAARDREYAIRSALGASRGALIRLTLCESLILSLAGAGAAICLAIWVRPLVSSYSPIQIPRTEEIHTSVSTVLFSLVAAMATTLLCGIAAALQHSRPSSQAALKDAGRSVGSGRRSQAIMSSLVSLQFGLTVVLLIAGGLMLRTLVNTLAADPGFRPEHAVAVTTHLPTTFYSDAGQIRALYLKVANAAQNIPGVQAAGIGSEIPLGNWAKGVIIGEGSPTAAVDGNSGPSASQVWITGHYLEAVGVPLKRGRFFQDVEYSSAREVAIINESLATKLWPGQDPLGRRLQNSRNDWLTVVGVVGDIKEMALNAPSQPQIYEPHSQIPDRLMQMAGIPFFHTVNLVSRGKTAAPTQIRQLTGAILRSDPSLAISGAVSLDDVVRESGRPQQLNTLLVGGFGGIALLLALLGVGSMLGYSVMQRRKEIGLRVALGAQPWDVLQLIVREGLRLCLIGVAGGLLAAAAATRMIANFLYGVQPVDPLTFALAPLLLLCFALLVSYVPAARASRVDPMLVLRDQ